MAYTLFAGPNRVALAAYLGHLPSQEILGDPSQTVFSLKSMARGGDHYWRAAMHVLGHEPAALAACALAELGLSAYLKAPDAPPEVEKLARDAVSSLQSWNTAKQHPDCMSEVWEKGMRFCLGVNVGGDHRSESGFRAQSFGRLVGECYSVVFTPNNPRYVRWFGEAAESCKLLGVGEPQIVDLVASNLLPFALADGGWL